MAVPTHEMRYYLPLCVPMAILCGLVAGARSGGTERHERGLVGAAVGICVAIAGATLLAGGLALPSPQVPAEQRLALVLVGGAAGISLLVVARRPLLDRVSLALVIASLCAITTQRLGVEPYRASKRSLEPQAQALARYLPADEPVWVVGPSDLAGKHASLYFYLQRPVRSFQPAERLPPVGSYCVLTSVAVDQLAASGSRLVFREIEEAAGVDVRALTAAGLARGRV
ncbi:MAG: hypothetical protein ACE5EG_11065, partial [Thermoanaerobaculia bacterium]